MKRVSLYIPAFIILAGLFSSCEKVIEFEGEALEQKIVLYSVLNPDSLIDVYISYSHPIFDPEFSYHQIVDADVRLFRDDSFIDTLTYRPPATVKDYVPSSV
ncbi:unnamed protein product, partial [marine sediment metagenome]